MKKNREIKEEKQKTTVEKILSLCSDKIKTMVDTKMVVGDTIDVDGVSLIPLSKVSVGFVAGGGEYDKKSEEDTNLPFAGGSGAGYSVSPLGFITIKNGNIKLLKVSADPIWSKLLEIVPETIENINKKGE